MKDKLKRDAKLARTQPYYSGDNHGYSQSPAEGRKISTDRHGERTEGNVTHLSLNRGRTVRRDSEE
jgi:hypothetical protein